MRADDPRHGTYAGAIQHWKDGETPCPPCASEALRIRKRNQLAALRGQPRRVKLGDRAWEVVHNTPRNQLSAMTGLRHERLSRYDKGGPERTVHCTTRSRILAAGGYWTPIGMQRRLKALSALGWSMRVVSQESGVDMDALKRLRKRETPKFVRMRTAEAILEAYERLCMKLPPVGGSATETRNEAQRRGYLPPLAWDDIDDPTERPNRGTKRNDRLKTDLDPVVVERVLAGDRLPMTRAERVEVVRTALARGWSEAEIEARTGITKATDKSRFARPDEEDAA